MSTTIRLYRPDDADAIAALYHRFPDNPNPVAGGVTGHDVERELGERDTAAMFLAFDGEDLVGTFGLFRDTGRRSARAGELIADMFFVAPAYRNGLVTGRLFTEAIEWMVQSRFLVLRLTVNPANSAAFKLYRRVGCVSVGDPAPGEDGNVELYNYIPLILRSIVGDLGGDALAALAGMTSFGAVTQARDGELCSDVLLVDGVRTVTYDLVIGGFRVVVVVDVDRGTPIRADLTGPDGHTRPLRPVELPYRVAPRPPARLLRIGSGALTCTVDAVDGTVEVLADGHLGPVLRSTWPSCHPDRTAGWRESQPCDLDVTVVEGGVRLVERHGDDETVGTVTLVDGELRQGFTSRRPLPRLFHTIGLRQGTLTVRDSGGEESHPLGLGVGVRDSSEMVAAARRIAPGGELIWTGDGIAVTIPVDSPVGLVHGGLLERRAEPGACTLVLRTHLETWRAQRAVGEAVSASADRRTVRMLASAGGVTAWREGGAKVLRSPHPRRAVFACNPRWSAGMWLSTEPGRHSRHSGLGWGVSSTRWDEKHPLGLVAPDEQLSWEITDSGTGPLVVDVQSAVITGEVVLWLTPNTRPGAAVHLDGTVLTAFRQVWANTVSVELADGRLLDCRPAPGGPRDTEIVVRSTAAGLLLGCVSPAGTPARWEFTVLERN